MHRFAAAVIPGIVLAVLMPSGIEGRQPHSALIVVSAHHPAYLRVESAVRKTLIAGSPDADIVSIELDAADGPVRARDALASGREVVVAIGSKAAKLSREISPAGPLVYAMVLDPASIGLPIPGESSPRAVTGVTMDVRTDRQFELIRELLPSARRIGVLYDPARSGEALRRAAASAKAVGLTLVGQSVRSDADVLRAAGLLAPDVDAFWALVDPTVLTAVNAKALILFSLRARKPFLAMSEGFVRSGALAALSARPEDVGRRAGEFAVRVLGGTPPSDIKAEMPQRLSLFVNLATAEHIGVHVPDALVARAETVYPIR